MLSFLVSQPCDECHSASGLLNEIEGALSSYGMRMWINKAFLLKRNMEWERIKKLIYYKDIVTNLMLNPFYYAPKYAYQDIESKVKALVNGLY